MRTTASALEAQRKGMQQPQNLPPAASQPYQPIKDRPSVPADADHDAPKHEAPIHYRTNPMPPPSTTLGSTSLNGEVDVSGPTSAGGASSRSGASFPAPLQAHGRHSV